MSIDAIANISTTLLQPLAEAALPADSAALPTETPAADATSFDSIVGSLEALNEKLVASTEAVHGLALGQVDNLHQVMMAGEQTRLAFDLMLQVRSKVLDAYQELLRMPV